MGTTLQDLKYSLRQLRRQPSYSVIAILILALGIGLSTALFSVIDAAVLRPLPYPHPEQLVTLDIEEAREGNPSRYAPSMSDVRRWRALSTVVSHAGTGRVHGFVPLIVDDGTPQRLIVAQASEDFLETYGITPILGRAIRTDDTRSGAPRIALLGHAYWQREFGGSRNVLGRLIRIQNEPATIVGVLPAGFYPDTAIWQAHQFSASMVERRGSGSPVIARLRSGVSLTSARAALEAATPPSTLFGPKPVPVHVAIASMYDAETRGVGVTLGTLAIAVGLILIIACSNVAGLTLARGASRSPELAIRAAIGAGRGRLVRQLLTEGLLLALAGGVVGVLFAYASLDSLLALVPLSLPANSPAAINAIVLGLALGLTLMTALLSGLVPALELSRAPRVISTMFAVGGAGAPLSKRTGQWLIGIEVALALVLMAGAGLIVKSFAKLASVDLGVDAANVMALDVEPLEQAATVRREYYAAFADALRHVPGVVAAGAIDQLALTGGGSYFFPTADTGVHIAGPQRTILPGFFEAMGVRPVAGRLLEDGDRMTGEAALINVTASRRYFGGHPVGHTLRLGVGSKHPRTIRIAGVVPAIRLGDPEATIEPEVYMLPPINTDDLSTMRMAMIFRLRDGASVSYGQLKQTAQSVGPRVLVGKLRPAAAVLGERVATPRDRMLLLSMLGAFGLLLALVGIFSVTAYAVARRTREIGVRVALGARRSQVVAAMIRDVVRPVVLGLAAGLVATSYTTRVITSFLFQTSPYDPATLIAVVVLLGALAALAAWVPARRASSIDPVVALRAD
ncbi:MAG TPA: ADOP family duplicated permease [Vicinamibacterales bacterium]|nr:ADOP family duplicated permease [Vicinamibacterales bacterium]